MKRLAVALALFAAIGSAAPAQAGPAQSTTKCVAFGFTCIHIEGSGLYVQDVQLKFDFSSAGECVYGYLYKNSLYFRGTGYWCPGLGWHSFTWWLYLNYKDGTQFCVTTTAVDEWACATVKA